MNTNATVIGLDIAKHVFVAVGTNAHGKVVFKKKLARHEVLAFFANVPRTAVGIEACAGAHYWARELLKLGHGARLIAAQHVKAYVSGNKNDTRDAQAIAEIRARACTKYVPINTEANQDLQMLHRARQGLMAERKALICRLRAFAHEYGKVFPQGAAKFRRGFRAWLNATDPALSGMARETLRALMTQLDDKDARLTDYIPARALHHGPSDRTAHLTGRIDTCTPYLRANVDLLLANRVESIDTALLTPLSRVMALCLRPEYSGICRT